MPTTNPRLNITLDRTSAGILVDLAKDEHISVASLARELILEALERREDLKLSELAKLRDKSNMQLISHKNAWKK